MLQLLLFDINEATKFPRWLVIKISKTNFHLKDDTCLNL